MCPRWTWPSGVPAWHHSSLCRPGGNTISMSCPPPAPVACSPWAAAMSGRWRAGPAGTSTATTAWWRPYVHRCECSEAVAAACDSLHGGGVAHFCDGCYWDCWPVSRAAACVLHQPGISAAARAPIADPCFRKVGTCFGALSVRPVLRVATEPIWLVPCAEKVPHVSQGPPAAADTPDLLADVKTWLAGGLNCNNTFDN